MSDHAHLIQQGNALAPDQSASVITALVGLSNVNIPTTNNNDYKVCVHILNIFVILKVHFLNPRFTHTSTKQSLLLPHTKGK